MAIPRIGQEVIIEYLEGDPDRPICMGKVSNEDQMPPYALPEGAHMKGQELINIYSQKDMVTTVQNTQATVVNGPHQTTTVTNGYQATTVKQHIEMASQTQHIKLTAATDITLAVGGGKIYMGTDGTIKIEGVHVNVIGSTRVDLNPNDATPDALQSTAAMSAPQAAAAGAAPAPKATATGAPLTAGDLQAQADRLNSYAKLLNNASEEAYSLGDKASGDAYRQEAINNAQAASIYSTSASRMIADSQRAAPGSISSGPFAAGWNTGDYSAGLPAPGNARPDYVTIGGSLLSGNSSIALNVHDGTTYLAGGVMQSDPRSVSWKPGLAATAGWIFGSSNAEETNNFLNGNGNQAYISIPTPWNVNGIAAITHAYGGGYAIELGVSPRGKISAGVVPFTHSKVIYQPK